MNSEEVRKILEAVGDLEVGQTANTFHCKTGHTNDRCYVTRKEDATLIYCHHCHGKHVIRDKYGAVKRKLHPPSKPLPVSTSLPTDIVEDPAEWSIEAKLWINKGKVSWKTAQKYGLCYSPHFNRVCIPVVFDGKYMGYCARKIGDGQGPKYLVRTNDREHFVFRSQTLGADSAVLVEDMLSSIRVGELGYDSYALQSTSLSGIILSELIRNKYSKIYIWLDNDNREVIKNQIKIKRTLSLYFKDVVLVKTDKDPKEYTDEEIENILGEC